MGDDFGKANTQKKRDVREGTAGRVLPGAHTHPCRPMTMSELINARDGIEKEQPRPERHAITRNNHGPLPIPYIYAVLNACFKYMHWTSQDMHNELQLLTEQEKRVEMATMMIHCFCSGEVDPNQAWGLCL